MVPWKENANEVRTMGFVKIKTVIKGIMKHFSSNKVF